jgi:hypothetical protein
MNKKPLQLTPQQLIVYRELERIKMRWFAFWFVMPLFAIGFLSFLGAVLFVERQVMPKSIIGGVDALLGWAVKTIVSFLFSKHHYDPLRLK